MSHFISSIKSSIRRRAAVLSAAVLMLGGLTLATAPVFAQGMQGMWGNGQMSFTRPAVVGTVTAVSGSTLTVQSKGFGQNATATTYTVDATNATVTKGGSASSVSSISVNDMIAVQGTVNGTTVTATSIRDGIGGFGRGRGGFGGPGFGHGSGVVGTVTAVSGNTITVTSRQHQQGQNSSTTTTYTIDATNATVTKNGATSSVSSIAVGDMIAAQGTVNGTTVTATTIRDGVGPMGMKSGQNPMPQIKGNGQPVVGGTITAINGSTLTITNASNVTYTVDVSSATVTKGGATVSSSSLAVGDNVVIQGAVNGSSVTASSVIDQGSHTSMNANGNGAGSSSSNSGGSSSHPAPFLGGLIGRIGGFFQHLFGFF